MTALPLSLAVINYGTPHLVRGLLDSLASHPDRAMVRECLIVDNGFPKGGDSRHAVSPAEYPFPVRFHQNPGRSYASGVNSGVARSDGEAVAILNSDISWLESATVSPLMEALATHPDVGIVGPQLVFPGGSWQRSHGPFPSLREGIASLLLVDSWRNALMAVRFGRGTPARAPFPVDYVDGAFMVVRRSCFDAHGGFDEAFPFYAEDMDFCWRARRAGWRTLFVPAARVVHIRGASTWAIQPAHYLERLYAARCLFVARTAGPRAARWYSRLQGARAAELAAVYAGVAALLGGAAWQRRAAAARAAAAAARRVGREPTPWVTPP